MFIDEPHSWHRYGDFSYGLYAGGPKIKPVRDNRSSHCKGAFYEYLLLARASKFSGQLDFVFTPRQAHGSAWPKLGFSPCSGTAWTGASVTWKNSGKLQMPGQRNKTGSKSRYTGALISNRPETKQLPNTQKLTLKTKLTMHCVKVWLKFG